MKRNKRMWHNEVEVRVKLPPMKIIVVSDEVITTSVDEFIKRFQQRPYPLQRDVPVDVHNKIIQKLIGIQKTLTPLVWRQHRLRETSR